MLASQASSLRTKMLESAKKPRDMLHISGFFVNLKNYSFISSVSFPLLHRFFFPGMKNRRTTRFLIKFFFVSVRFQLTGLSKKKKTTKS